MSLFSYPDPVAFAMPASNKADVLALKRPAYASGAKLEQLRDKIQERAEALRKQKQAYVDSNTPVADRHELFPIISELLELKFLDEENQDCVVRFVYLFCVVCVCACGMLLFLFFLYVPDFVLDLDWIAWCCLQLFCELSRRSRTPL